MPEINLPQYRLENGLYAFYLLNEYLFSVETVAVLFDKREGILHKHGCPRVVEKQYQRFRDALSTEAALKLPLAQEMRDDLTIVQGKFKIEELNRILQITGYARKFYTELFSANQQDATSNR
ncbi:MAG: hypothetical protein Q7S87_00900 [Agitococcus sp.]|nr:hypothetical protein [Agitococcus sp.]